MISRVVSAAAFSLAVCAPAAQAATFLYLDEAAFDAGVAGVTTENFDDPTLVDGLSIAAEASLTAPGVFEDKVTRDGSGTTIRFAGGATAFGGLFDTGPRGFGRGIRFTLLFDDGHEEQLSQAVTRNSSPFFGVRSDDAFTGVRIDFNGTVDGGRETYSLDDLRFQSTPLQAAPAISAAPEPQTWAMMVVGFLGMGWVVRHRKTRLTRA